MRYNLNWPNEKNILLIIPPLSNLYPNSVEDVEEADVAHPSLGIMYISSFIKKNGYNTILIDDLPYKNENTLAKLSDLIREQRISVVLITCMTANFVNANKYASIAKSEGCVVVLGGPHASCSYYTVLQSPYYDIISIGEGEITTLCLLNALYCNEDVKKVENIAFKEGKDVIRTKNRDRIKNLDLMPIPDYLGMNMDFYVRNQALGIISSRGCPNSCLFCSSRCIWGRTVTYRSEDNIAYEMDFICKQYDYAGKELLFYDDNITLNKMRLRNLCKVMVEREYNFRWKCMSRVDSITPQMLYEMKKAGCYSISFGVESASEKSLKLINKSITLAEVEKAIDMCEEAGILFHGYFMIGFPWETKSDFLDTVSYIHNHKNIEASLSILTPYPGTDFYENKKQWGIEIEDDWSKYNHISSAIKSKNYDEEDLYSAFALYLLNQERGKNGTER